MRCRLLSLLILLGLITVSLSAGNSSSSSVTQRKADLLIEAVGARASGDFAVARARLEEILVLDPVDATAQRMLFEVKEASFKAVPPPLRAPNEEVHELLLAEELRLKQGELAVERLEKQLGRARSEAARQEVLAEVEKLLTGPGQLPEATIRLKAMQAKLAPPPAPALPQSETGSRIFLVRGKAHLAAGDYKAAREALLAAQAANPDDSEVAPLLEEATRQAAMEEQARLDRERGRTRGDMLADVSRAWERPRLITKAQKDLTNAPEAAIRERLRTVQLPRVTFSGLPLSQALISLGDLAEEQGAPVNLVLMANADEDPLINITLRDLSLERVLDFVSRAAGFEYHLEPDAVVLRRAEGAGSFLETGYFPITRSAIIRLTGVADVEVADARDFSGQASGTRREAATIQEQEQGLRAFLERAGVPFASVEGSTLALADGQLIVRQTPGNLAQVRDILSRYSRTKQVQIEARFLEVAEGEMEEFGVEWLISNINAANSADVTQRYQSQNRRIATAFGGDAADGEIVITGLDQRVGNYGVLRQPLSAPGLINSLDLAAGAMDLAKVSGAVGEFNVEAVVRALARRTGSDLMSAPKITVLSGKRAEITVAQEMIYPRAYGDVEANVGRGSGTLFGSGAGVAVTAGTPRDFTTRNVGVEMVVTPHVEDDDSISLMLEPQVTEFEGYVEYGGPSVAVSGNMTVTVPSGFYQPVFSVRRVRTEVTIWDGATVVMGGLTREQMVSVRDKVPVLGDIPVLGRLFRHEGESSQKRNLIIFVTANLVSPGGASIAHAQTLKESNPEPLDAL